MWRVRLAFGMVGISMYYQDYYVSAPDLDDAYTLAKRLCREVDAEYVVVVTEED
jgi:hypothetical protein